MKRHLSSWWPPAAGLILAGSAAAEVLSRWDLRGARTSSALPLVVVATAPIVIARSRPTIAAAVSTVATLLLLVGHGRIPVAVVVAHSAIFYLFGLRRPARQAVLAVLPFVPYLLMLPIDTGPSSWALLVTALTLAAAALGSVRRVRDEAAELRVSNQMVADTLLEHVARGERARIARELHDVVAHHISMISVQAETARLTTPGMPAEGAERLAAIGDTARVALTEMRRLLGVLRDDAGGAVTRSPQPGLAQLTELVDEARESAGASTRLIVRGHVSPLDPGTELTAYRIVQEALTNARRHASSSAVDVELFYTDEGLRLRVRDNGPGPRAGDVTAGVRSDGHGLLGMRERAAMIGGHLHVGPAPASGFLVEALLPSGPAGAAGAAG